MTYFECWRSVAAALLTQALAGEPVLAEREPGGTTSPDPDWAESGWAKEDAFGFESVFGGGLEGSFWVFVDGELMEASLMGEGADQRAGWLELLREVAEAAAGELLARTGRTCHLERFGLLEGPASTATANAAASARLFALTSGDRTWSLAVRDQTREAAMEAVQESDREAVKGVEGTAAWQSSARAGAVGAAAGAGPSNSAAHGNGSAAISPGVELLLDVELEAALRFGCREMPLGEILDLGPGDVVELDRHIADPVDLIVGDKIVARGEVVLVNGNFGLRVTEVAEPRRRLESIRCLF